MPLDRDPVRYHDVVSAVAVVGGLCALVFVACLAIGLVADLHFLGPRYSASPFRVGCDVPSKSKVGSWSLIVAACLVAIAWSGCTARPQVTARKPKTPEAVEAELASCPGTSSKL